MAYDPALTSPEGLVDAIRATASYGAELPNVNRSVIAEQEAQDSARAAEFAELRLKAIATFVIGALAMVVHHGDARDNHERLRSCTSGVVGDVGGNGVRHAGGQGATSTRARGR